MCIGEGEAHRAGRTGYPRKVRFLALDTTTYLGRRLTPTVARQARGDNIKDLAAIAVLGRLARIRRDGGD